MLPEGCSRPGSNDWGTPRPAAPSSAEGSRDHAPGPPRVPPMFQYPARPLLAVPVQRGSSLPTPQLFGNRRVGRLEAQLRLADEALCTNPNLWPLRRGGGMRAAVTPAATDEEARPSYQPTCGPVSVALGTGLWGGRALAWRHGSSRPLKDRGLDHRTAESCTGWLMAKRLTDIPGPPPPSRVASCVLYRRDQEGVLRVPAICWLSTGPSPPRSPRPWPRGPARCCAATSLCPRTGVGRPRQGQRGNEWAPMFVAIRHPGRAPTSGPCNLGTSPHASERAAHPDRQPRLRPGPAVIYPACGWGD